MRIVVALGGNAIQHRDELGTAAEQRKAIRDACISLAALTREHEIVVTHGNGPQVGLLLAQNESNSSRLPAMPLDVLVAETQGMIGYLLQSELRAALIRAGVPRPVVAVVTQIVVDSEDPAFSKPSKPVGAFLDDADGERLKKAGIPVVKVGDTWRRVVGSPAPIEVVEMDAIRILLERGCLPVVAGGGGVPVVREGAGTRGVAAVVDKDRTAALLGRELNADLLLILTDIEAVEIDGKPVHELAADHAAVGLASGVFPIGSMGPKIEAALEMAAHGGRTVIAHLDRAAQAVKGEAGTTIA